MSCLITTLTGSAIKKTTRKENKQRNKQKQKFQCKNYLSLKAPSNNFKMKLDKTLTTKTNFFLTIQQMETVLNDTE